MIKKFWIFEKGAIKTAVLQYATVDRLPPEKKTHLEKKYKIRLGYFIEHILSIITTSFSPPSPPPKKKMSN
jgi:hypothetical protein